MTQVKFSLKLITYSKNVDVVFIHLGEYINLLPVLCSKLVRLKSGIFHLGGNKVLQEGVEEQSFLGRNIVPILSTTLLYTAYSLTDKIICQSERIISFGNLEKYRSKTYIAGGRCLDMNLFRAIVTPSSKENLVGFVGKLWQVKGVLGLIDSIPLVLECHKDVRFVLIGEGYLRERIEDRISSLHIEDHVTLTGWIPHEKLPECLGQMKLMVLPSFTEGVPGVVIEAMASGVVVLATPVGGVLDLVKNRETGFVLEDNSPQCIAKHLIEALNYPEIDALARNARAVIENEYSYDAIVKKYENLLKQICKQNVKGN